MHTRISKIRLHLWRIKIRLLPWTRPKPPPKLAGPALPPAAVRSGAQITDGTRAAPEQLWSELLAHYLPALDRLTLLELGCGRGELLHLLAESTDVGQLIGVDDAAYWNHRDSPLREGALGGRLRLLSGALSALALEPRSIDAIVCIGYLERLTPEAVADTLAACFDVLRPGGSLVVRVQLCTAAVPSPAHGRFATPYPQLLVGERDLARLLRARFDEPLPYVNWLTATSYVMLFHQAGFETLQAQRIADPDPDPGLADRLDRALPGISPGERARSLEAHLVRPFTPEDLARAGEMEDTRSASIRERTRTR